MRATAKSTLAFVIMILLAGVPAGVVAQEIPGASSTVQGLLDAVPHVQATPPIITILSPAAGTNFARGSMVPVIWDSPANDFTGTQMLFDVVLVKVGVGPVEETRTPSYSCYTVAGSPGDFRCTANLLIPVDAAEGQYSVLVRFIPLTLGGVDQCAPPVPAAALTCAVITGSVDTTAPAVTVSTTTLPNAAGWFQEAPSVHIACDDGPGIGCGAIEYTLNAAPNPSRFVADWTASEGTTEVEAEALDLAGNGPGQGASTVRVDSVEPTASISVTPAAPASGWYQATPTATLTCTDAAPSSGVTGSTLPSIQADDSTTLAGSCTDAAGNSADASPVTINLDVTPPSIDALCPLKANECADKVDVTLVPIRFLASDTASGIASRSVTLTGPQGSRTLAVSADVTNVDLKDLLNLSLGVHKGTVSLTGTTTDVAGRTTSSPAPVSFEVDTSGPEKITVYLTSPPDTFVANNAAVTLTYQALWTGGPLLGTGVALESMRLVDASDGTFSVAPATTDLAGIASFTLSGADVRRQLSATITSESPVGGVEPSSGLNVTWTNIELRRADSEKALDIKGLPGGDQTAEGNLWVDPTEIYSVAFLATTTWDDQPLAKARVTLTDEAGTPSTFSALSNAFGIVRVPTKSNLPDERVFTSLLSYDPTDGPVQTFAGPSETVRWAEVRYSNLAATTDNSGWHKVTDTVTFEFDADLYYGDGSVDAANATVTLTSNGTPHAVLLDANGHGSESLTYVSVTDTTPTLTSVTTPKGITTQVSSNYSRHRWTEIVLAATPTDLFMNVGAVVSTGLTAKWLHDEDNNGLYDDVLNASFNVTNAAGATLTSCAVNAGVGSCLLAINEVYDAGLTFQATSADHTILRQAGGSNVVIDPVWTRIVIGACATPDAFVDITTNATFTCSATYAHSTNEPRVPSNAALEPTAALPASCSETTGAIENGTVTMTIRCDTPSTVDASFTIDTAHEDVTAFTGTLDFDAKYARVEFRNVTTDEATEGGAEGYHDVAESVTFSFAADYVYGAAPTDRQPVIGGTFALSNVPAGQNTNTTGPDGSGSFGVTFGAVTDIVPALSLVETPQGITQFVAADYGREIWTEIVLSQTPETEALDGLVNVNDTVTYTLLATWAHDEDKNEALGDPVASIDLEIQDSSDVDRADAPCQVRLGGGSCNVTINAVYDSGLTFVVTSSDKGITRQAGGQEITNGAIWTEIIVAGHTYEDSFMNVGDTVRLEAVATYAHTGFPAVPNATLAFGSGAPAECSLTQGTISDSALTASVRCSDVTDETIPIVISAEDNGITRFRVAQGFDATWTKLLVTYTPSVANGRILDHNDPVRFDASIAFAHNGTPAPTDTFFAFFATNTEDQANCVTEGTANTCTLDVSKASGTHTFTASAASLLDSNGDGLVEEDITVMDAPTPPDVTYRWSSIGFKPFECFVTEGNVPVKKDCNTSFTPRQLVTVKTYAVASDDENQTLEGDTVTLSGQQLTTGTGGLTSRNFVRFSGGCITVSARGVSADFGTQTVDWDTPRFQQICWG